MDFLLLLQITHLLLYGPQWKKYFFATLMAHYPYSHIQYDLQLSCEDNLMVDQM